RVAKDGDSYSLFAIRHSPPNHFAGTSWAALSDSRTALSFSMRAKVSDMCSVRPSQISTCTSAFAPAMECVDLVCVRSGVSRLRHPPLSTDFPGSPMGSYTADDS